MVHVDSRALPDTRDLGLPLVLSALVAALLAVTSVAGLIFGQRGVYRPDAGTLPAFIGQGGITLLVGLPLLAGSMWYARRGSLARTPAVAWRACLRCVLVRLLPDQPRVQRAVSRLHPHRVDKRLLPAIPAPEH